MLSRRGLLAAAALAALAARPVPSARASTPTFRLGSLPFGTVAWEAAVIKARGLDTANGFSLEVVKLAGNDAARIAFMGGQVDAIVFLHRQRSATAHSVETIYHTSALNFCPFRTLG